MRPRFLKWLMVLVLAGLASGCGKSWQMDYGKPEAQFHARDVVRMGGPFVGKKVSVRGKVVRIENGGDGNHLYLEHDIHCVFPTWHYGEGQLKPGDEITVDGFLVKCREGGVEITPALARDPTAPFAPIE